MRYCGIKILGHSKTDFKHKTAFANRKRLLEPEMNFVDVKIESREKNPPYSWFTYLKISIGFSFICTILILTSFLALRIDNISIDKTYLSADLLNSTEISENIHAARLMYNSARLHLKAGNLDYAQEEITRVLKLYPTNIDALNLMLNVLDQQCIVKNKYCSYASWLSSMMSNNME